MELNGSWGKKLILTDEAVIIRQKSIAYGSYEKKIPFSQIKEVIVKDATWKQVGWIRIVEINDDRQIDEKKFVNFALVDDDTVLFNGTQKNKSVSDIKKSIEAKVAESEKQTKIKSEYISPKKKGKLKYIIFAVFAVLFIRCGVNKCASDNKSEEKSSTEKIYEIIENHNNVEGTAVSEISVIKNEELTEPEKNHIDDNLKNVAIDNHVENTIVSSVSEESLSNSVDENTQNVVSNPEIADKTVQKEKIKVYVGSTGKKYHYRYCKTLKKSKFITAYTIDQAQSKGYTPCRVCDPPTDD